MLRQVNIFRKHLIAFTYSTIPIKPIENVKLNKIPKGGPNLKDFLVKEKSRFPAHFPSELKITENIPYLNPTDYNGNNRKVYFEVYGCQMNVSDTEIVWSILKDNGYIKVDDVKNSDVILIITCSIREGAETKIFNRLKHLSSMKQNRSSKKEPLQIGVLGCMAERLKANLLEKEKFVDIVAGPDSYKDLPRLLAVTKNGSSAVNVLLSLDETYADISPIRLNSESRAAFVSIMRGCDNMCSYCIVPFTRGRERSRPLKSIESEVQTLAEQGIKEITLLGQNVNSYRDLSSDPNKSLQNNLASGFKTVYKDKKGGLRFAELLEIVANAVPNVRIRFTSPHPKDFPDNVLDVIKLYPNICKSLHLPAQSGNSAVLERMRRGYTRESYLELVTHIRELIPDVSLSSDFICGFCSETDEEFDDTISLINTVKYNTAFLFAYSMREKTTAHRRYQDDIHVNIKKQRLQKMIEAFRFGATELQSKFIGKKQLVLIEGPSKRSSEELVGRNDANIKVIIPLISVPSMSDYSDQNLLVKRQIQIGDFVAVNIHSSNSQILKGDPLYTATINEFCQNI